MTMTTENQTTTPAAFARTHDDAGRIVLPYTTATLSGIFAVVQCAAKDDITPIICAVQVSGRTFVATDRYRVGEWTHTPNGDPDAATLTIPRAAAEWLAKQSAKILGAHPLLLECDNRDRDNGGGAEIVFTEDSITIRYQPNETYPEGLTLATTRFDKISGNFPPVVRLFPAEGDVYDGPGAVNLGPALLEGFIKGAIRSSEKNAAMRFQLTKTPNPNKPGPVQITFGGESNRQFRGMIQPNIILR